MRQRLDEAALPLVAFGRGPSLSLSIALTAYGRILLQLGKDNVPFGGLDALFIGVRQEQLFEAPRDPGARESKGEEITRRNEIMTAAEVADYLRVPLKSLYTWRYTHDGPPSARVGKYLRYRRTDVDEWLEGQVRFNRADGRAPRPKLKRR